MPVDIAFVTVNYNTLECVRQLAAFFKGLDVPFTFTFTVVDNASSDGSQEYLQAQPEIQYIQTGGNIGYGRAINRGVAAKDPHLQPHLQPNNLKAQAGSDQS